jgi:alkanesulfonate monooxygenase SsuD/methylene tetrahydromethanopterin reductase-like flavin-dependent oxidoreductase (luciferase family)
MAEDAGAADLIAGGRLQLGISRGSPEQVIDGWRYFGYASQEGQTDADMARRHAEVFLEVLRGEGFAQPNPRPMFPNPPGLLRVEPHSEGLRERIWWGSSSNATAEWAAQFGLNLQSSTLKTDESGEPLHVQQRKQIEAYREAWKKAGHKREPRVSVSRSIFALVDDRDRAYFGGRGGDEQDQIGYIGQYPRDLRPLVCGRARRAREAARRGRGHCGCRYAFAHGAEPARSRIQRSRAREHPHVRCAGARLALSRGCHRRLELSTTYRQEISIARRWSREGVARGEDCAEH